MTSDPDAVDILFVGDGHGDLWFYTWVIDKAVEMGVDHIVSAGDFGYWEHTVRGMQFLDTLNHQLELAGLEIWFVDGNHENHALLRTYEPREDGLVNIRDNIVYIPRGARWVWARTTFMGIGGAYSIDKDGRTEGVSWWPEETITDAEVFRCVDGGPVDVVVSHDVPMFVDLSRHLWREGVQPWGWHGESLDNRLRLTEVFDGVKPRHWIHGHYHLDYTETTDRCTFIGLNANINQYGSPNWKWEQAISLFSIKRKLNHG